MANVVSPDRWKFSSSFGERRQRWPHWEGNCEMAFSDSTLWNQRCRQLRGRIIAINVIIATNSAIDDYNNFIAKRHLRTTLYPEDRSEWRSCTFCLDSGCGYVASTLSARQQYHEHSDNFRHTRYGCARSGIQH